MSFLLDTCAILYVAENTAGLSPTTMARIGKASPGEVFVSAISVAELACLQERGRIALKKHWRVWWDTLINHTAWPCLPITAQVMVEAYSLPSLTHRDPADRVLIATTRLEGLTLVTTDSKILGYRHVATVS